MNTNRAELSTSPRLQLLFIECSPHVRCFWEPTLTLCVDQLSARRAHWPQSRDDRYIYIYAQLELYSMHVSRIESLTFLVNPINARRRIERPATATASV